MKTAIQRLLAQKSLSYTECYALFTSLIHRHFAEQAAVLALFRAKQETVDELLAIRSFFLESTHFNKEVFQHDSNNIVDITGTGGDGLKTFNISTAASLVVASYQIPVAKHGGGRVTSMTGSADVIQRLNIHPCQTVTEVNDSLRTHHYAFLQASQFNHLFGRFKDIRSIIGFPTLFNILGPLLNPVSPKRLVLGVYQKDLMHIVAQLLIELGVIHALVVHAENGMDELSVCGDTHITEISAQHIENYTISPKEIGLKRFDLNELKSSSSIHSAQIIRSIFDNQLQGAKKEAVVLNAAAGFLVAHAVSDLTEGVLLARELIDSGVTSHFLSELQGAHHESIS